MSSAPERLYRCRRCDKELVAPSDDPSCPDCGGTLKAGVLTELVVIHFDAPSGEWTDKVKGIAPFEKGVNRLACQPEKEVAGHQATGVPAVVNCPLCKETAAYKEALQTAGADPRRDLPRRREG